MDEIVRLKEALSYNPTDGKFLWRADRPTTHFKTESSRKVYISRFAGKVAGCEQKVGHLLYRTIRVNGKLYFAHRLAWAFEKGYWPNIIDHINGETIDNRICNLRDGDNIDNGRNCRLSKNNTSGVNGVWWNKLNQNWVAEGHFTEDGKNKKVNLGSFQKLVDARKAREEWETKNNFSERHGK